MTSQSRHLGEDDQLDPWWLPEPFSSDMTGCIAGSERN